MQHGSPSAQDPPDVTHVWQRPATHSLPAEQQATVAEQGIPVCAHVVVLDWQMPPVQMLVEQQLTVAEHGAPVGAHWVVLDWQVPPVHVPEQQATDAEHVAPSCAHAVF